MVKYAMESAGVDGEFINDDAEEDAELAQESKADNLVMIALIKLVTESNQVKVLQTHLFRIVNQPLHSFRVKLRMIALDSNHLICRLLLVSTTSTCMSLL